MITSAEPRGTWTSTSTLFAMIGIIEPINSPMRRSEEIYRPTAWALAMCREYGLEIPKDKAFEYQRWILLEKYRDIPLDVPDYL